MPRCKQAGLSGAETFSCTPNTNAHPFMVCGPGCRSCSVTLAQQSGCCGVSRMGGDSAVAAALPHHPPALHRTAASQGELDQHIASVFVGTCCACHRCELLYARCMALAELYFGLEIMEKQCNTVAANFPSDIHCTSASQCTKPSVLFEYPTIHG